MGAGEPGRLDALPLWLALLPAAITLASGLATLAQMLRWVEAGRGRPPPCARPWQPVPPVPAGRDEGTAAIGMPGRHTGGRRRRREARQVAARRRRTHLEGAAMRAYDLLLTGLLTLALAGLGSLVAGVVWPTAAGRLVTVGAAAVATGLIGHQLALARLAADRERALDRRHAELARER